MLTTPMEAFAPVRIEPHTSRLAIITLILGILSPFTLGATGLPAIVCAIVALVRIRNIGWVLRGRELAINGLVFGAIGLAVPFIVIPRVKAARDRKYEEQIRIHLFHMRSAVAKFQSDTGVFPDRLTDLVLPAGSRPTGTFPNTYHGPYLRVGDGIAGRGIPVNPYAGEHDRIIADHWQYDPATGLILPAKAREAFIDELRARGGSPGELKPLD
jgi:hypothetical protein